MPTGRLRATPLLLAAKFDKLSVFNKLLSLGAQLYVNCTQLCNPLHYAIMNKNERFIEKLLYLDSERCEFCDE